MKHVNAVFERDKQVIAAVVRRFGPLSRAGIHELTHIRQSTTSKLVRELIEENVLREGGRLDIPLGRKQSLLHLNEQHRFVAAIEFDDESVTAAILDLEPKVRHVVSQPATLDRGEEGLLQQLQDCLRAAMDEAQIGTHQLIGIGIADPGLVASSQGLTLTSTTIDFWRDVPLRDVFEKQFGVATFPESKTRAKTIAEQRMGAGGGAGDVVYLDYGTGIGAGIISGGNVLLGTNGGAGEMGHIHLVDDGPICKCGSYGCLEAVAGLRALEMRVRRAWTEMDGQSSGSKEAAIHKNGWEMLRAAASGDKICGHAASEIANYLGIAIANMVNLFNPSVVVIDSRLELAGPDMLEQIIRTTKRKSLAFSVRDLVFRYSQLGELAGVLGAALICLDRYFEIPALKPPRFLVDPQLQSREAMKVISGRKAVSQTERSYVLEGAG